MHVNGICVDARLQKTGANLLERMITKQKSSIRGLSRDRNEQIRYYRWLEHKSIKREYLINTTIEKTATLISNRHVLAIQDTTEINYQSHSDRVSGLGTVGNGTDVGIFLHPLIVVDADTTQGLGFGAIHHWNRFQGKDPNYKKLPIETKESYRWVQTAETGKKNLSSASCVTFIGDRENDIYEFLDRIPDEKTHLLIRARSDRNLECGTTLVSKFKGISPVKTYQLELPRTHKRQKKTIDVELKYTEISIKRPTNCTDKSAPRHIKLFAVEAKEVGEAKDSICWRLLTTHEITSTEDAMQIIKWYQQRWQIEQLFRTLKSQGLDIESSQLETENKLSKLLIVALNAAMRIMQLVLARDGNTKHKTHQLFSSNEIECMNMLLSKLEGRTKIQKNPYPDDNLAWASWIIGRLGGWKGYTKSEGPVGPIVMKRGLERFNAIFEGYKLLKNTCTG